MIPRVERQTEVSGRSKDNETLSLSPFTRRLYLFLIPGITKVKREEKREGKRERERESREWKKWELVGGRGTWKPTVPHERLKVKLRSTTAREFGFPLVTEYSQSYPTLPAASAALTLKYDLILPLRTSNRRGKRFRDVPPPSGRPYGCLPRGRRTIGP